MGRSIEAEKHKLCSRGKCGEGALTSSSIPSLTTASHRSELGSTPHWGIHMAHTAIISSCLYF